MILVPTCSGHFRLQTRNAAGLTQDTGWFENLVLDAGLNRMGTGSFLTHCAVGTGTGEPNALQTALEALAYSTSTIVSQAPGANQTTPYYGYRRLTYRFPIGGATGNLSEVGVGWAAGSLYSRARIVDQNGDPSTITVLAGESLDVTYELRLYPPAADAIGSVTIGAATYALTGRASAVTSGSDRNGWGVSGGVVQSENVDLYRPYAYSGLIGTLTQSPSGTSSQAGLVSNAAYSNNSYERNISANWALGEGNVSGIRSIVLMTNGLGRYQFQFDPAIPKSASNTLAINFKVAWARYS